MKAIIKPIERITGYEFIAGIIFLAIGIEAAALVWHLFH